MRRRLRVPQHFRMVLIAGLLAVAGCASQSGCGCVPAAGPDLGVMPPALQFAAASEPAQTLQFIYGGPAGSAVVERDDCGPAGARIVSLAPIDVDAVGEAHQTVTPVTPGTCSLTYRFSTVTVTVAVAVR